MSLDQNFTSLHQSKKPKLLNGLSLKEMRSIFDEEKEPVEQNKHLKITEMASHSLSAQFNGLVPPLSCDAVPAPKPKLKTKKN